MFTDKISGKSVARPALQEMLGFVREGDEIFVHSIDRLARNLVDLRTIVQELTNKGVTINFTKENLKFSGEDNPTSTLMLNMLGSFAEFERSMISARQREGIDAAKKEGKHLGRPVALTAADLNAIKQRLHEGESKIEVAKHFGVSRAALYKALARSEPI